jgi:hypothetical protein
MWNYSIMIASFAVTEKETDSRVVLLILLAGGSWNFLLGHKLIIITLEVI